MEYEMPTIPAVPKGMLENILASEALGRTGGFPFTASDWLRNGYRTMPPHVFSTIKLQPVPLLHSNQPGSSNMMGSHTPLPLSSSAPFNASRNTFTNDVGGALGVLPVQKKEEKLASPKNLETKRKRDWSKGCKANGSSRKKIRTDSCTDLTFSNEEIAKGKAPTSRSRKRVPNGEEVEKTTVKKQSHQGSKKSEDDAEQRRASNELSLKDAVHHGSPNSGSTGILDIYGLKTMPVNLSNYIVDLPINNLLSGSFQPPQSGRLGYEAKQTGNNSSVVKEVSKILELMPKQNHTEAQKSNMEGSVNLGSKSEPWRFMSGSHCPVRLKETYTMASSEETNIMKITASSEDSNFPMNRLPLYPLKEFLGSLELPANEPLESLLLQTERESGIKSTDHTPHDRKNGSIPPLQYSVSLNGASRSVPKRNTKNGNLWLRGGIPKCVNGSLGLDIKIKENVKYEETGEARPNKRKRCEAIERAGMIDLNMQYPEQLLESSMANFHNYSLLPESSEGLLCLSLPSAASEARMGDGKRVECVDNKCYDRANSFITVGIDVGKRSTCSQDENHLGIPPIFHVETVTSPTPNIQVIKKDINNANEVKAGEKTKRAHKQLQSSDRYEDFENQGQEDVPKKLVLNKYATQKDEASQLLPSHLPTLELNMEKCRSPIDYSTAMPSSPGVEAAARILYDMANSPFHDNDGTCPDTYQYQENSQVLLQKDSLKDATNVHRLVDHKNILNGDFKEVEVCKDRKIKTQAVEKRNPQIRGSLLLAGKNWSIGNVKVSEGTPDQFQPGDYDSKQTSEWGGKNIARQDITEARKMSDFQISGKSSRSSKSIVDGTHSTPKGLVLFSSNQNKGNPHPKSLAGSEPARVNMHLTVKSSQNMKTVNGNHPFAPSAGQSQPKVASVGHAKSARKTLAFTGRKR
eukprot:Gb_38615 [translate_table: standard]